MLFVAQLACNSSHFITPYLPDHVLCTDSYAASRFRKMLLNTCPLSNATLWSFIAKCWLWCLSLI